MKIWVVPFVLALLASSTVLAQKPTQAARDHTRRKQELSITLEVPNATVKAGTSTEAKIVMTNISHKPFDIGFGSWVGGLMVRDSQGNESLTEMERCLRSNGPCNTSPNLWGRCPAEDNNCEAIIRIPMHGGPVGIMLAPGKSDSGPAEVNPQVYDLTRPGKYTLQWQMRYSDTVSFNSNTVAVTIIP
jgi:hypothetical protein